MNNAIRLIALGLLGASLSQLSLAECTSNRNADIAISKPDSRYSDNLDGTVADNDTGLVWQKCSVGQTWNAGGDANSGTDDSCDDAATAMNWQAALNAAQTANSNTELGYNDWFLPNVNQLESLTDKACYSPSINESLFPNTQSNYYWSASPYANNSSYAWFVHFDYGYDNASSKDLNHYVRLVRASQ